MNYAAESLMRSLMRSLMPHKSQNAKTQRIANVQKKNPGTSESTLSWHSLQSDHTSVANR